MRAQYLRSDQTMPLLRRPLLADWCRRMARHDLGRLVLTNLIFDIRRGKLPAGLVCDFVDRLVRRWQTEAGLPTDVVGRKDPALQVFEDVRQEMLDDPAVQIHCQGGPDILKLAPCSTITPSLVFSRNLSRLKGGSTNRGYVRMQELRLWQKHGSLDDVAMAGATMPPRDARTNGRRIAWVTPTDGIKEIRDACEQDNHHSDGELAAALRARLGLFDHVHVEGEEIHYVEVRYPQGVFQLEAPASGPKLAPPTVFDGGPSRVYRSQRDENGWGKTIDLDRTRQQGVPEAVHLPVPFVGDFSMLIVGKPDRTEVNILYSELAATAPEKWTAKCVAEIENACSQT